MTWDGASKTFADTTQVQTTETVYPQEHQPLPQRCESAEEIRKRLGWAPVSTTDDDLRDKLDEVCSGNGRLR